MSKYSISKFTVYSIKNKINQKINQVEILKKLMMLLD